MKSRPSPILPILPLVLFGLLATGLVIAQMPDRAVAEAMRAIYRLPTYSAFDWISARYDKGTLTLQGFARTAGLKKQAETVARKAPGIDDVINQIEVLPAHQSDDEVRVRAYAAIYASTALERYAPGGQLSDPAIRELLETARLGLDGADVGRGPHGIHIIVSGGRILLLGTVRTTGDRQQAEALVRGLPGAGQVTNQLRVPEKK